MDKRKKIMENALHLFSEKGFRQTTITDISKTSYVSEASIYDNFTNKEDLLFSIIEKFFQDLIDNLHQHFLGIKGTENKLRKFIWHYLSFLEHNTLRTRLYFFETWSNQNFYKSGRSAPLKEHRNILKNIIQQGIEEKKFNRSIKLDIYEAFIIGTVHHMAISLLVLGKPFCLLHRGEVLENLFFSALEEDSQKEKLLFSGTGKKEVILQAAMKEFSIKGFTNTTISQIASRAQITEPTLYEHFKNKEDLLMSIPELAVEIFLNELKEHLDQNNSPESLLKLFLWNQAKSYDSYPHYYRVLLYELRCNPKFYKTEAYKIMRRYSEELTKILQQGIDGGFFRNDIDIIVMRDMYFGTLDHILLEALIINNHEFQVSDTISDVFDLYIKAIAARKEDKA